MGAWKYVEVCVHGSMEVWEHGGMWKYGSMEVCGSMGAWEQWMFLYRRHLGQMTTYFSYSSGVHREPISSCLLLSSQY